MSYQPAPKTSFTKRLGLWLVFLILATVLARFWLLPAMGNFLVNEAPPKQADAVLVLNTGAAYYPRLIQAAELITQGLAPRLVVNGNRKTEVLRELETMGYTPAVPWDTEHRRILELLGINDEQILSISVENAFDTISEAQSVAPVLKQAGIKKLLIVTSRFHTHRAGYIWNQAFGDQFEISTVAATKDPFDPDGWWRHGRQIRQLLGEYGGWLFYFWNKVS